MKIRDIVNSKKINNYKNITTIKNNNNLKIFIKTLKYN